MSALHTVRHFASGSTARRLRVAGIGAAALGLLAAGLVSTGASPAQAAVPGLVRVTSTSASTSLNKSATATCPAGLRVVGAGAELNGAGGQVVIDEYVPNAGLTAVTTWAYEVQAGYAGSWTITAYAMCANAPAGLVRVVATSASNSFNKGVTAVCPAGTNVIGAGAQVNGAVGEVITSSILPNIGLTSVGATGYEDATGLGTNWSVSAFAICANPLPGLQRVEATTLITSGASKFISATCPAGTVATGGGLSTSALGNVVPDDIRPATSPRTHLAGAYRTSAAYVATWYLRSVAICATA